MAERLWWLDDPKERYWVETLSERRATLGRQLHAPQVDGSGRPNWRYGLVSATRPGDVVLHWLNDRGTRGFVGWSIVAGPSSSRPIVWHARGTYGRRRPRTLEEQPGYWVPLRNFRELDQPLGLAALNQRRAAIAAVHDRLRRQHGTPLYLALSLYESSRRGVEVGQGYLFKWPAALNPLFPSLRPMSQVSIGDPTQPWEDSPPSATTRTPAPPRRRSSARLNRAVERHAVAVATAWYRQRGYAVEDVGSRKSWDLEAAKSGDFRRVEVKGSTALRDAVDLTVNEVSNAREWFPTDLVVVDQIGLHLGADGVITTSGGRLRRWENWTPAEDSLFAVVLSHLLPDAGQSEWAADLIRRHTVPATTRETAGDG